MDIRTVAGAFLVNIMSVSATCGRSKECTVRVIPNHNVRDSKFVVDFSCSMSKEICEYVNGFSTDLMVNLLNQYLDNCYATRKVDTIDEGNIFFYSSKIPRVGFTYDVCVIVERNDENVSDCTAWFIPNALVSKLYNEIEHGDGACERLLDAYKQLVKYGQYIVKWVHDEHNDNI